MHAFALLPLFATAALSAAVHHTTTDGAPPHATPAPPTGTWNLRWYTEKTCGGDKPVRLSGTQAQTDCVNIDKIDPKKKMASFGSDMSGWTLNLYTEERCKGNRLGGDDKPGACTELSLEDGKVNIKSYKVSGLHLLHWRCVLGS